MSWKQELKRMVVFFCLLIAVLMAMAVGTYLVDQVAAKKSTVWFVLNGKKVPGREMTSFSLRDSPCILIDSQRHAFCTISIVPNKHKRAARTFRHKPGKVFVVKDAVRGMPIEDGATVYIFTRNTVGHSVFSLKASS